MTRALPHLVRGHIAQWDAKACAKPTRLVMHPVPGDPHRQQLQSRTADTIPYNAVQQPVPPASPRDPPQLSAAQHHDDATVMQRLSVRPACVA